jgi:galactokinase
MTSEVTAFAPGRVNLIGEHTDYNQGLALPFAVRDGVTVRARAIGGDRVKARALDLGEEDSFDAQEPARTDGWQAYVRGAVAELTQAGCRPRGARLEIEGTLPQGSGLSSSAALEVALIVALTALFEGPQIDRTELAKLGSRIENDWVGAQTGLLDQLASLFGQEDHALRIDFRSLEVAPIALELNGFQLATLDSGEQHAHADSGYNERRSECARAAEILGIESLRDTTLDQAAELPEPLDRRLRHVICDNQRVEETIQALAAGDLEQVGELLDRAHASLRDDYEVSTPAVEAAVAHLKEAGALGARIMGGGFGGHVLALFAPRTAIPDAATAVEPGPGARLID